MTSERAEVAGRIRATVGDASACNALHHLWLAVTGETAPELDREARGRLFLTLADLIEPERGTCHVVSYPPGSDLHYETCSECGCILSAMWPGDGHCKTASYCPNCGARVVEEGR